MMKRRITVGLFAVLVSTSGLYAGWGAKEIGDNYRPKTNWMNHFASEPDVIASDSINDAIERCDDIVGSGKYCVVGIYEGDLNEHVEISRSKTKLIGIDNAVIHAQQSGTMFYIGDNTKYVSIEHLNIEGKDVGDGTLFGIIVEGKKINCIAIRNNTFSYFSTNHGDAHAIAVYGTGATASEAIRNILISGNTIHDMRTGSSESIALNGNVVRWQVSHNDIYDINNIAIDIIGGEGTAPTKTTKKGRVLPGKYDAARFGFVEDNYVENLDTSDNPAYNNEKSWAAAIYIDGGHHVRVSNNVTDNTAWGYEIGAENCVKTRHIEMFGNQAEGSYFGDLVIGGYNTVGYKKDTSIVCDPLISDDSDEGHGYVRNITVYDNAFLSNEMKEKNILLQYRVTHAIIEEPGIDAVNDGGNGSAQGDENAIRIQR
jgi:hypothetical protein